MPGIDYTLLKVGEARVAGMMATPAELKAMGAPSAWSRLRGRRRRRRDGGALLQAGGKVLRPADDIPERRPLRRRRRSAGRAVRAVQAAARRPAAAAAGRGARHRSAGTSCARWTAPPRSSSTRRCSAGRRARRWTWARWASTSCSRSTACPAAAMMTKAPDAPAPGWRYYFRVDAIDAAAERVRQRGGAVTMGPQQVPGGNWVAARPRPAGRRVRLDVDDEVSAMSADATEGRPHRLRLRRQDLPRAADHGGAGARAGGRRQLRRGQGARRLAGRDGARVAGRADRARRPRPGRHRDAQRHSPSAGPRRAAGRPPRGRRQAVHGGAGRCARSRRAGARAAAACCRCSTTGAGTATS